MSRALAAALLALWLGAARADEPCPAADPYPCLAARGDTAAMYIVGRDAYERARGDGDFGPALAWARKLAAAGDKNGERLLKMTYIQLGSGAHRDLVQAYRWIEEGIAGGADYLVSWRRRLAEKMGPEELARAREGSPR